ncbi:hypothetical protein WMF30_23500 [Sorangium sp. So ce134]
MVMTQPAKSLRKRVWHGDRGHPLATVIDPGPYDTRAIERGGDA